MLRSGLVAYAGRRLLVRDPLKGLLSTERLVWTRQPSPFLQHSSNPSRWDYETSYNASVALNLDGSVYRDGNGDLYLYYVGDNDDLIDDGGFSSETDYDQIGLATGPTLDNLVKFGTSPVVPLGGSGAMNRGDAQAPRVFHTGSQFVMLMQGNATAPGVLTGDQVTIGRCTSIDGKTWTLPTRILNVGAAGTGDADDLYQPTPIPNAPGGCVMYYTAKDGDGNFGIMAARMVGGLLDTPVRLSTSHLLRDGISFCASGWYEAASDLLHLLYFPGGSSPGGIFLATAPSAMPTALTIRRQLMPRRPGFWDANPRDGQLVNINGVKTLIYAGGGSPGIGYAYAT